MECSDRRLVIRYNCRPDGELDGSVFGGFGGGRVPPQGAVWQQRVHAWPRQAYNTPGTAKIMAKITAKIIRHGLRWA